MSCPCPRLRSRIDDAFISVPSSAILAGSGPGPFVRRAAGKIAGG